MADLFIEARGKGKSSVKTNGTKESGAKICVSTPHGKLVFRIEYNEETHEYLYWVKQAESAYAGGKGVERLDHVGVIGGPKR